MSILHVHAIKTRIIISHAYLTLCKIKRHRFCNVYRPLHLAVIHNHEDVASLSLALMSNAGFSVDTTNKMGQVSFIYILWLNCLL